MRQISDWVWCLRGLRGLVDDGCSDAHWLLALPDFIVGGNSFQISSTLRRKEGGKPRSLMKRSKY